jgi:hypothetical protein
LRFAHLDLEMSPCWSRKGKGMVGAGGGLGWGGDAGLGEGSISEITHRDFEMSPCWSLVGGGRDRDRQTDRQIQRRRGAKKERRPKCQYAP